MPTASAHRAPRRWNVEVDGIKWLPRLCDKARMSRDGTLGAYLVGHSPVDFALLTRLGVTTDDFISIATSEPNDTAVLAALRARGFDESRVRRWSDRFERAYGVQIRLWDLDEGYRTPNGFERALLTIANAIQPPLMAIARRLLPRP